MSVDCSGVKSPGMVSDVVQIANVVKNPEKDSDNISIASSSDSRVECEGAVVLNNVQDKNPCFQNIEVTNSSDVHFGNKTYYQGPVTIKQILYTNPAQNSDEHNSDQKVPITDDATDKDLHVIDSTDSVIKNGNVNSNSNNNYNVNANWTQKTKGYTWIRNRTKKQLIVGTLVAMLTVVCVTGLTISLIVNQSKKQHINSFLGEEQEANKPNNDLEALGYIALVSRREWIAEPPDHTEQLARPVVNVLITETETNTCTSKPDCIFIVRHLQTSHKEGSSFWDIKYNFLVGGDGNVYEGRGWKVRSSSVTDCNKNSIGIAFVGKFSQMPPSAQQIDAARRLIGMGVKLGHIKSDYKVIFASQILGPNTGSSNKLNEAVKKWPHWSNVDYFHNNILKLQICN